MIDQFQNPGFVQTHHHIVADQNGRHSAQTPAGKFRIGLRILIYVLFGETYFVLGKKLFRRFAMGSGLGSKQNDFLHLQVPPLQSGYIEIPVISVITSRQLA